LQEVEVDLGCEAHSKINRAEGSVAAEQVEGEAQILREQGLRAAPEEIAAFSINFRLDIGITRFVGISGPWINGCYFSMRHSIRVQEPL